MILYLKNIDFSQDQVYDIFDRFSLKLRSNSTGILQLLNFFCGTLLVKISKLID